MKEVVALVLALLFPVVCLLLVLWLARMEETLIRDVRRSGRKPDPAPILRMPATPVVAGAPVVSGAQTSDGSRSAATSLGGSTNR